VGGQERTAGQRGEALVGIVPTRRDLQILEHDRWYRIPKSKRGDRWPPRWFAPYEGKAVGAPGYVRRIAEVLDIRHARREELFPLESAGQKAGREYFVLNLGPLVDLPEPVMAQRFRRIVFIRTTHEKLWRAQTINHLYDDSPLEDRMWDGLKQLAIPAERQWEQAVSDGVRFIDFAIFCNDGQLAVETDGDTYHTGPEKAAYDNDRDNGLQIAGWRILRFNTERVLQRLNECLVTVGDAVQSLNGLASDDHFARRRKALRKGDPKQLAFGEEPFIYDEVESEDDVLD
jgi:very-short-patch-repair endonuclease